MAVNWSRPTKRIIPGDKARQGEIILQTPLIPAVFIGGLIGAVILGIVIAI
jgi:hypothetical protein